MYRHVPFFVLISAGVENMFFFLTIFIRVRFPWCARASCSTQSNMASISQGTISLSIAESSRILQKLTCWKGFRSVFLFCVLSCVLDLLVKKQVRRPAGTLSFKITSQRSEFVSPTVFGVGRMESAVILSTDVEFVSFSPTVLVPPPPSWIEVLYDVNSWIEFDFFSEMLVPPSFIGSPSHSLPILEFGFW